VSRRLSLTVTEIYRTDASLDAGSDAYAAAPVQALDDWAEQDPEAYRSMAAPRPTAAAVAAASVEVEDEEGEYQGTLEQVAEVLELDQSASPYDELDDLDALESLDPLGLSVSFLEDAGLLPVANVTPLEEEEEEDPVTDLTDECIAPLRGLGAAELPELVPGLLQDFPLYEELSGSYALGEVLVAFNPPVPARIARRLWKRDLDRLAG
jgi:hypothetical protein